MALTARTSTHIEPFIPLSELDSKDPFTAQIRSLSTLELLALKDTLTSLDHLGTPIVQAGRFDIDVCSLAIQSWENLLDADGNAVAITRFNGKVDIKSLNLLPIEIISEIAEQVITIST